jgi:hypothetical protein
VAISSRDGLIAAQAAAQHIQFTKTVARTSVAATPFSVFDIAGNPGAGVLAGTSTTAGVVPTDATAGCPVINAFTGSNTGYLTRVRYASSVACRLGIYDMLWKAGAYSFNASVTLSSQPSYASRIPGGDYAGTQIWVETVTAFTGNLSIAVTYTNQGGTAGRSTGTVATGVAPTVGRMIQLPLQAGDTGVQKIESVTATVATAGTFNLLVLRPLWEGRCPIATAGDVHGPDRTGMPQVFADSALFLMVTADSTSTGIPDLTIDIANG